MKGHWQGVDVIDCAGVIQLGFMGTLGRKLTRHYQCSFLYELWETQLPLACLQWYRITESRS